MFLIYDDENIWSAMSEEERNAMHGEYGAFTQEVMEKGISRGGDALHPTNQAVTVRVRDGESLRTDGPFAETKEQLGGYYILDCKDLDEALELAAKIPSAKIGSIEIRPVVVWE